MKTRDLPLLTTTAVTIVAAVIAVLLLFLFASGLLQAPEPVVSPQVSAPLIDQRFISTP